MADGGFGIDGVQIGLGAWGDHLVPFPPGRSSCSTALKQEERTVASCCRGDAFISFFFLGDPLVGFYFCTFLRSIAQVGGVGQLFIAIFDTLDNGSGEHRPNRDSSMPNSLARGQSTNGLVCGLRCTP